MPLIVLIAAAAVSYTVFTLALARAGAGAGPYLTSGIYLAVGAVVSFLAEIAVRASKTERLVPTTTSGIVWSVVAGVLIGAFSIILVKIFGRGGLAYVMPVVYGGTIVLSVVAARLLFKETIVGLQLAGILVIAAGIAMVVFAKMYTPMR